MKINVFECNEKEEIYPVYTTKNKNKNVCNLLLIHDNEKSHYVLIKNLNNYILKF